jgi:hypothetical protein
MAVAQTCVSVVITAALTPPSSPGGEVVMQDAMLNSPNDQSQQPPTQTQVVQSTAAVVVRGSWMPRAWERFLIVATLLAFVVDVITMASILAVTNGNNGPNIIFTNIRLNALHALVVWCIGFFCYLAYVGHYWKSTGIDASITFAQFVKSELIIGFKHPFVLLPGLIFMVMLVWVAVEVIILVPEIGIIIGSVIGLIVILALAVAMSSPLDYSTVAAFRNDVTSDWPKWDKAIQSRLVSTIWISCSDMKDVMTVWSVPVTEIHWLLAMYAEKHPRTCVYGSVYNQNKAGESELYGRNVLASKRKMEGTGFYVI